MTEQSPIDAMLDQLAIRVANIVIDYIKPVLEQKNETTEDRLIDRQQTLELLNIDSSTLYKWEMSKKLVRHGKIGGKIYYSLADVRQALKGIQMYNH